MNLAERLHEPGDGTRDTMVQVTGPALAPAMTETVQFGCGLPLPPRKLMFMDADHASMLAVGSRLLEFPKRIGAYFPGAAILDIGCGYGRLAYALVRNGHRGPYLGLDILPDHVAWLRDNVKPYLPAGSDFIHLDVANGRYNPGGKIPSTQVEFPRPDWKPDLALLFSVFTHMYPDDIGRYVAQLRTVLGHGAAACITFFLLNTESRALSQTPRSSFAFPHRFSETCSYYEEKDPLHAIAFDEAWVYALFRDNGLRVEHLAYGTWCGRQNTGVFQDTMIVRPFA